MYTYLRFNLAFTFCQSPPQNSLFNITFDLSRLVFGDGALNFNVRNDYYLGGEK